MDDFAARVDHTVLGPETTAADVRRVAAEAADYGMNACVPPCYLDAAVEAAPGVRLVTVVGFPHGQHAPETLATEATAARDAGADELDLVGNMGHLLGGDADAFRAGVARVVDATSLPVKVIVQAPRLDEQTLRTACEQAAAAGADYVKTATGFGPGGATVGDVRVMAEYLPVKAAGGIRDRAQAERLLDAGAARIGTSAGVALLTAA